VSIYLPGLALEALGDFSTSAPIAVTEPGREQLLVAAVNDAARACGVGPGLKLNAACALAASLKVIARSPSAERVCLESLAEWAHCITSLVSLEPPDGLSLEVAGSLRLFGGLAAVKQALAHELGRRRWSCRLCAAPTPLAASWLARQGACDVLDPVHLPSCIGALPLVVTGWPPAVQALLLDMGVRTVGDCLRLPRGGFARRVGQDFLDELDRALGKRFDPRRGFEVPQKFDCRVELTEESADVALLVTAVGQMLDRLVDKLRLEQAQIQSFRLLLVHRQCQATVEHFALIEPAHEKDRFVSLITDRLERIVLPEPAIGVGMSTDVFRPLSLRAPDLFAGPASEPPNVLIERLRERFGAAGVYGIAPVADHRPERAWTQVLGLQRPCAEMRKVAPWVCNRPLWVLPAPLPLASSAARRHYAGSLRLASEAERIESGWWDEQDLSRDYYTAVGAAGERLWVYRDRDCGSWHLHGVFG
jgi:protein ImuB